MNRRIAVCAGIAFAILIFFCSNLFFGSVSIPSLAVMDILLGRSVEKAVWTDIVLRFRLPQALTALLAGPALAVCGLMLQTLFKNPLAGPSILGISNGANLGVAFVMLYSGGFLVHSGWFFHLSVVFSAFLGALLILMLILYFSYRIRSNVLVLIIGIMVGYLASSAISVLNAYASADNVRAYVMWGMGNFSGVQQNQLPFYSACILFGLCCSVLLIKPLNALLLGENYAMNLGVNIKRSRITILAVTGLLTAVVTAFCGPISFIGMAVPHLSRLALGTSNQKILLPVTLLTGAAFALFCNLLTLIPFGSGLLPLNAVTPLLGAPIVIYVILCQRNIR
ncbi:MAG: iron ABC transporter permease [Dysgonamonadaceae bacterium]|jgi:iron complex transport system permease protein|nr:iron ABC transporter permease [Dysgonamonadaceae bacterium]